MARPIPEDTLREKGKVEVLKNKLGGYNVIFTPPIEALPRGYETPEECRKRIIQINPDRNTMTFFPFKVWGLYSMHARYNTLEDITVQMQKYYDFDNADDLVIEDILSDLAPVFIKDYNYGLGFLKEYRHIPEFIENLQVKHLNIIKNAVTEFDKEKQILTISEQDFSRLRRNIDSITARARKIANSSKQELIADIFISLLSGSRSEQASQNDRSKIRERITKSAIVPFSEVSKQKQEEAIDIVRVNSRRMLKEQPQKLVKLRTDIELVTLDELIQRFEEMLEKDLHEAYWQRLFEENPFILNMAFGVPIVKIQSHASVGGRKIPGGGDKIADFLVKNSLSNNAAIVEIKTPSVKLLSSSTYRGEVYRPSPEISGAVNQILDQINKFQKNIATLKEETRNYEIETYSVMGVLVIGKYPLDNDARKSFDLFRGNSKNIHIITFDELLEKLRQLRLFLGAEDGYFLSELDLPF